MLAEPPLPKVWDLAISADGTWLYMLAGNGLYRANRPLGSDHGQITPVVDAAIWHHHGVALTSDGYAWVVSDGNLHKVSLATGVLVAAIRYQEATGAGAAYGGALSPDETLAYLSTSNGKLVQVELGTGHMDMLGQLQALKDDGYRGIVSMENHYTPAGGTPEDGVRQSFAGLRRLLAEME